MDTHSARGIDGGGEWRGNSGQRPMAGEAKEREITLHAYIGFRGRAGQEILASQAQQFSRHSPPEKRMPVNRNFAP